MAGAILVAILIVALGVIVFVVTENYDS